MARSWGLRRARLGALVVVAGSLLWTAAPAAATTVAVTNTNGSGTGSLAAAVAAANADTSPPRIIRFRDGMSGVINLTGGTLTINENMTIVGPGAGAIAVDGLGNQILSVPSSATVLSISGLDFTDGVASQQGGAINNVGTVDVSDSVFANDAAGAPGGGGAFSGAGFGGAIYNLGTVTIADSTFTDDTAGGDGGTGQGSGEGEGGAIFSAGQLTVNASMFTGNTAGGDGGNGQSDSGRGFGGAIYVQNPSNATITDSTLTENSAGGSGGTGLTSGEGIGGALDLLGTATLTGDTIDANSVGSASQSGDGAGVGFVGGTVTAIGTIVSDNTGPENCGGASGTMMATDSLEGPAGDTSCGFDLPSAEPFLEPLADNGGPTETQVLRPGSPAIGAVTSPGACPAFDQRGAARQSGQCDAGAYEVAPPVIDGGNIGSATGPTTAFIDASVSNPDVEAGTVMAEYGTTTAYGSSTAVETMPPVGGAPFFYVASLTGLQPATVYHVRLVAQNPDGTTFGPDEQITTPPVAPSPPPPASSFTFGRAKIGPAGKITLPVNAPDAGRFTAKATFTVRWTVTPRKGVVEHVTSTYTYGTATVTSTGHGTFKLVIGLRSPAARVLKLFAGRQVTIAVSFVPTGGTAHSESKKASVRRSPKGKFS